MLPRIFFSAVDYACIGILLVLTAGTLGCTPATETSYVEWRRYGGDLAGSRYSVLDQIDRSNVEQLEVAWTYHTGDMIEDPPSTIECNPIVVDGVMYVTSPTLRVIALDAATGEEMWTFDPFPEEESKQVNRGVSYWEDGEDRRILLTAGPRLFALDAETGRPIGSFGDNGRVGLTFSSRTPGVVYNDLLILGSVGPGHIRAFDVRTGQREWIFHTIPHPGEHGYDTWSEDAWKTETGANDWSGMALDREDGIVFSSTASPSPEFYGAKRHGKNLFANAVIALDAATGERIWHFQTIRHGIWDLDLPAPPHLVTVERDGEQIDALAQVTKTGQVFVFDRTTGEPLFPIEEREVPPSDLPGEEVWPTQPFPLKPTPFSRQGLTEEDLTNISPEARAYVLERFREVRGGPMFTPPSREGTVVYPGFHGGAEWSGASFDPTTGMLYVNSNEIPWIVTMEQVNASDSDHPASAGEGIYQVNCASCHGPNRKGDPPTYPSLVDIEDQLSESAVVQVISDGRGLMPPFPHLSSEEMDALTAFLFGEENPTRTENTEVDSEPWFVHTGWNRFVDPEGYPAVKPPWGTLNAIDLNTGEMAWKVPLGTYPELADRGLRQTGTENFGGTIVTAGGLVFIGASKDEKFRAFDKATGEVLWETTLPAGGYATPSTYEVDGRQYVVIAAGGGTGSRNRDPHGTKAGDAFVAFALP
jgi:quinoprotein glucose dehydrogenase